ncbi:MAG: subclass B1 metallo-beta-lactamase [Alphaproteobacteria bacterium]|nr:subclass B1 metallo-beta-lactamase [Alphaproteobacteria bacterium]
MVRFLLAALFTLTLNACATDTGKSESALPPILPEPPLEKIAEGVWIHKSYEVIKPWGPILSQGLVIKTDTGLILVDTAWGDDDTEILLEMISKETGELPAATVVTHAHQDKMGGMDALHEAGIETFAHAFTNEDAPKRGLTPAKTIVLENSTQSTVTDGVTLFYPGAGHTRDNIVVYYAPAKILFGGCLIRPGDSNNLGNTADGDVANWAKAVRKVAAQFPEAEIIIPSHGAAGGRELLDHTIALAEEAANE